MADILKAASKGHIIFIEEKQYLSSFT